MEFFTHLLKIAFIKISFINFEKIHAGFIF